MKEVNTLQGAMLLADNLLCPTLPVRYIHTKGVVETIEAIIQYIPLTVREQRDLRTVGWLHDIGYSLDVAEYNFHPLNGYTYLKSNGWLDTYSKVVAHHSFAMEEAFNQSQGLYWMYKLPTLKLSLYENKLMELLTIADMFTNFEGTTGITLTERIDSIEERKGTENMFSKQRQNIIDVVSYWLSKHNLTEHFKI